MNFAGEEARDRAADFVYGRKGLRQACTIVRGTVLSFLVTVALAGALGCGNDVVLPRTKAPPSTNGAPGQMVISRADSRPPTGGPPGRFSGSVTVTPTFAATPEFRVSGGSVTFEPGARSAWHSHRAGQMLVVTAGTGWVQAWGEKKKEMKAGDVVWTPAGVKHWHGATKDEAMTHLAIQEPIDGVAVDWMEPVSDAQYRGE